MRRKLLLGNWKMNKLASEAKEFAVASKPLVKKALVNNIDMFLDEIKRKQEENKMNPVVECEENSIGFIKRLKRSFITK